MQISVLSETLIGSEIVKLGGEIREKIRQGEKIYNFTVGDFDPAIFPIPKELEEGIVEAYRRHFTNYPAAEGNLDLRESISIFTKDREQLEYRPEEILVSSGGRPLIYSVFRTVVDPGDKVIYAVPSWNNNHYTHLNGGEHVVIEATAENNFMPTADAIRPHIAGAALLCLCSPQNPTGTTISQKDLSAICELVLEENARRGPAEKKLYVLYDQMYWQLTFGDIVHYNPVSLYPAMREYTVFIDAISKMFAATGVRVGWAMGPAPIMKKMNAIMSHIGCWAPMAEQKAVAVFLREKAAIDSYLAGFKTALLDRLRRIHDGFKKLKGEGYGVDVLEPEAGIYLTIKVDLVGKKLTGRAGESMAKGSGEEPALKAGEGIVDRAAKALADRAAKALIKDQQEVTAFLLNEAGLAVVPFSAFGAPKTSPWYRLSVGTCRLEDIPEMFLKLKGAMKKLED